MGGLFTPFARADAWGCECVQFYLTPSRTWSVPPLSQETITKFREAWRSSRVREVLAHVPYLVNLASPDKTTQLKSQARLATELEFATKLGVHFLVLHPGSPVNTSAKTGIKRLTTALNKITASTPAPGVFILLETMAGQGVTLGSTFEQLAAILGELEQRKRFGVCFDTSHVFAAGYDLRGKAGYERVMKQFNAAIGVQHIRAIHLNDSKAGLGLHVDRHAPIGEGAIGLETFRALVTDRRFENVPKTLEVPNLEINAPANLKLLRKLQGG